LIRELEREVRHAPRALRYPLFLVGLIILVIGGVIGEMVKFSTDAFVAIAAVGFLFLVAAVLLR
jgi:uncharacterized membrane protein (UPF0136 family)